MSDTGYDRELMAAAEAALDTLELEALDRDRPVTAVALMVYSRAAEPNAVLGTRGDTRDADVDADLIVELLATALEAIGRAGDSERSITVIRHPGKLGGQG